MKRLYFFVIALLALGCDREPAEVIFPEPDYANVSLSSRSAVVDREGGVREIFVETNRENIAVECSAQWLEVSVDGCAITIFVDENSSGESRQAVLDVIAGDMPDVAKTRFKLMQMGDKAINLSSDATANCYIAATGTTYSIRADVKGNGKRDGNSRYMATFDSKIYDAAYAELLWEATYDGDKTRSCAIIDGAPVFSAEEGLIYFTTGDIEGNALISINNSCGDILWSWHIWVCNDSITTSSANGLEWMDRNIGALSNNSDNISNRGMLYQWGRKDPFLPSTAAYVEIPTHSYDDEYNLTESEEEYNAIQSEIERCREIVNINNMQTGDGVLSWLYAGFEAPVELNAPGNISYSVEHPTTFLGCRTDIPIGEYVFDWYMQQDIVNNSGIMMQSESMLWGDSESDYKTIFDPCPPGYCVPPRGAFGEIPSEYACAYLSNEWSKEPYGWRWTGGNGDFFPASGNFDVSGLIGETSERMLYWTAESFGSGNAGFGKAATLFVAFNDVYYGIYPLLDATVAGSWYSYGARACGASVRCVKETN